MTRAPASVTPARAVAYAVVRRVFEQDAWADRALHGEARRLRLDARERALATQLAFGTVQRAATLDYAIERLTGGGPAPPPPPPPPPAGGFPPPPLPPGPAPPGRGGTGGRGQARAPPRA